jgi:hypothetical protein
MKLINTEPKPEPHIVKSRNRNRNRKKYYGSATLRACSKSSFMVHLRRTCHNNKMDYGKY